MPAPSEPDDIDPAILRALRGPRILAISSTREGGCQVVIAVSRANAKELISLQFPETPSFFGGEADAAGPADG